MQSGWKSPLVRLSLVPKARCEAIPKRLKVSLQDLSGPQIHHPINGQRGEIAIRHFQTRRAAFPPLVSANGNAPLHAKRAH